MDLLFSYKGGDKNKMDPVKRTQEKKYFGA